MDISSEDGYYVLQYFSLASPREKLSSPSPVCLLWTVFGADQYNSSAVPLLHTGVPTNKHRAPQFLLSFPQCHWKDWCMRRWLWPSDVSNTTFFPYSDLSAALHSWTPKACMVTVKKSLAPNTSKRETKSFWVDLYDTKPFVWCINWYFIFIAVQWGI